MSHLTKIVVALVVAAAACGDAEPSTSPDTDTGVVDVAATDSAGNRYDADGNLIGRAVEFCPESAASGQSAAPTTVIGSPGQDEMDVGVILTGIVFSDASPELVGGMPTGYIELTNTGPGPAELGGLFLVRWAHPTAYRFPLPDATLAEDEAIWVMIGDREQGEADASAVMVLSWNEGARVLPRSQGNVVLYTGPMEGRLDDDPEAVVDYVQWGPPEYHPDGVCVAVAAGMWDESAVIDPADSDVVVSLSRQGPGPGAWTVIP